MKNLSQEQLGNVDFRFLEDSLYAFTLGHHDDSGRMPISLEGGNKLFLLSSFKIIVGGEG